MLELTILIGNKAQYCVQLITWIVQYKFFVSEFVNSKFFQSLKQQSCYPILTIQHQFLHFLAKANIHVNLLHSPLISLTRKVCNVVPMKCVILSHQPARECNCFSNSQYIPKCMLFLLCTCESIVVAEVYGCIKQYIL